MAIKKWSSKWVETNIYKTLEILMYFTKQVSHHPVVSDNKEKTRFKTICPFHKEKTASFMLHNNTNNKVWMFKCLGCGVSGDIFRLLMKARDISFPEALSIIKKTFPGYYSEVITITTKKQLRIPFPEDENGNFIWLHPEMSQLGFQ